MLTRNRGGGQKGIQSIEVGARLLDALVERGAPMILRDLAAAADMAPAKAHRYLVSFIRMGLAERLRETGQYDLGPFALRLGLASLSRLDAVRLATAELARLRDRIGETTALAVWGNYGSTPPVRRFTVTGRRASSQRTTVAP